MHGYTNVVWNLSGNVHVLTLANMDKSESVFRNFEVDAAYVVFFNNGVE